MNDPHSYPHRPNRLPPKDQLIMGLHAITEVLQYAPDRLLKIFTVASKSSQGRKSGILYECEKKGVPIDYVSEDLLTKMAGSDSHQSFVAHIKGRKFFDVSEFLDETKDEEKAFVLMLSEIFDPQNFGAILRSAECFGVDGVVWSKNRGCDLTPMVAKASCGASELLRLIRISNLADALDKFKEADFEIVAAVAEPKALPLNQFRYAPKTVLIVGSEGEGIQPLLCKKADRSLYISTTGKIQSLNVAQATAVLLSRWVEVVKV
jgi:23S rRNA (guanosine2251-2'-O)-methyltransferase